MAGRLTGSPTVQTLVAFVVVYVVSRFFLLVSPVLAAALFTLSAPVTIQPWTVVTSVYSHANLGHLVSNSVALVLVGIPLERSTPTWAYHAFFVTTGALAGVAHVYAHGLLGAVGLGAGGVAVLGASGAVFAMFGYVLAGNRLTSGAFESFDVPPKVQVALFVLVAAVLTWVTAAPGVALIAHFTGLLVGLVAGRIGILPEKGRRDERRDRGRPRARR